MPKGRTSGDPSESRQRDPRCHRALYQNREKLGTVNIDASQPNHHHLVVLRDHLGWFSVLVCIGFSILASTPNIQMVHNHGVLGLLSCTHFDRATATTQYAGNIIDAELDARVASYLLRNELEDCTGVSMHDLLCFFSSYETRASRELTLNPTEALSKPNPVSIVEDSKWKSIEDYTDSFRNVPPVVLRGILACIGVPMEKFLSCHTSGELVDALFSELITRTFPNLDNGETTRDVELDILKIKNFVWMYEMNGTKISAPGIAPNSSKIPDADVVDRFTAISKIVHYLGMKEIQSIGQSLRCMVIGQNRSQLANEFLVNLGYQAMHQGSDLVQALKIVRGYRVSSSKGLEILKI